MIQINNYVLITLQEFMSIYGKPPKILGLENLYAALEHLFDSDSSFFAPHNSYGLLKSLYDLQIDFLGHEEYLLHKV